MCLSGYSKASLSLLQTVLKSSHNLLTTRMGDIKCFRTGLLLLLFFFKQNNLLITVQSLSSYTIHIFNFYAQHLNMKSKQFKLYLRLLFCCCYKENCSDTILHSQCFIKSCLTHVVMVKSDLDVIITTAILLYNTASIFQIINENITASVQTHLFGYFCLFASPSGLHWVQFLPLFLHTTATCPPPSLSLSHGNMDLQQTLTGCLFVWIAWHTAGVALY